MITLEPVSERTFDKIIAMELPPEQRAFVAPNVKSLAQAWLYSSEARPYAICSDGEPVGFIMFDWEDDEHIAGIWRFMIAPEYQRRGYGREALRLAVELARTSGTIDVMALSYLPGNEYARNMYYSVGFRETGEIDDGEIMMRLYFNKESK